MIISPEMRQRHTCIEQGSGTEIYGDTDQMYDSLGDSTDDVDESSVE